MQSLGGEGCSLLPQDHFWIASERVVTLGRVGPAAGLSVSSVHSRPLSPSSIAGSYRSTYSRIRWDGRNGKSKLTAWLCRAVIYWCVFVFGCAVEVKGGLINAIAVGDYRSFVLRRPLLDYGDAVIMPGLIDV